MDLCCDVCSVAVIGRVVCVAGCLGVGVADDCGAGCAKGGVAGCATALAGTAHFTLCED